jgi:lysozyme family protein
MASFSVFLPSLLRFEGGFVDDPYDPGGATNKGVTLATFRGCAQRLLQLEPTLDNLKSLTDAQAGVIYKALYWDRVSADAIDLQALADIVVDFLVNAGTPAVHLLQSVLNDQGADPALAVDGVIGRATLQALQRADQTAVYRGYRRGRMAYYEDLAHQRPALKRFLQGWLNRVAAFPVL